ncbi:MAG: response regulator transcription factor [Bacteroidota bacterium]
MMAFTELAPTRIIVADDHPLWRRGVCTLLNGEPDLTVVGEASDGAEALRLLRTIEADVIILDMEMPVFSGVDVTRVVRSEGLPVSVLALSAYDEPEYVSGLMSQGAAGYITKEKPPEVLLEAVRAVARGEGRWFVRTPVRADAAAGLSQREREVLALLAEGHSNKGIAKALFISENTVRNHLGSLYAKLGVETARQAVAWAWRRGLGGEGTSLDTT